VVARGEPSDASEPLAPPADLGAVVLCGGRSVRMGRPKESLDFGSESLLGRVVRVLAEAAHPIVVVAAPGQSLPALPAEVELARDPVADRGPLQGIAVGLGVLASRTRLAFVSAADTPLLRPAFVRRLFELCGSEHDVAVPHVAGHLQPLAAVYATTLAAPAAALIAAGERCPRALCDQARTRLVTADELLADPRLGRVDPALASLRNVNTPAEYAAALSEAAQEARAPKCYNRQAREETGWKPRLA
jgi:molybdopterin-guanine dinucleotide biosynthesis protein A